MTPSPKPTEIAKCRHCGNGVPLLNNKGVEKWVECDICGMRGPKSSFAEYAVKDWNTLCAPALAPFEKLVDTFRAQSAADCQINHAVTRYSTAKDECADAVAAVVEEVRGK